MSTHRDMARERMVVGTCSVGALECWRAYVSSIRHISWSTSLSIRPTEPLFEQNSGQLRYQNSCSPSTPARPLGRNRRGAGVVLFTQDTSSHKDQGRPTSDVRFCLTDTFCLVTILCLTRDILPQIYVTPLRQNSVRGIDTPGAASRPHGLTVHG